MPERFDCAQAFRRLGDYLDRELSADEIRLIEEHLALCAVCASEFTFEQRLLRELKRKAQECKMPEEIRSKVLKALEREG